MNLDFGKLSDRLDDLLSQRIASIGDSMLTTATVRWVAKCIIDMGQYPDLRILVAFSSRKHSSMFAVSPKLDEFVYKSMFRRVRKYFESGLFLILQRKIEGSTISYSSSIDELYSDRIKRHQNDKTIEIRLENITKTLNLQLFCHILALIVYFSEIIIKNSFVKAKKKKIKRRKKRRATCINMVSPLEIQEQPIC